MLYKGKEFITKKLDAYYVVESERFDADSNAYTRQTSRCSTDALQGRGCDIDSARVRYESAKNADEKQRAKNAYYTAFARVLGRKIFNVSYYPARVYALPAIVWDKALTIDQLRNCTDKELQGYYNLYR